MSVRSTLARGALAIAIAAVAITTTLPAPVTEAAPVQARKDDNDNSSGGSHIGSIPIIGDVVGVTEDASPAEIAVGVVTFAAGAAETFVPIIVEQFGN